MPHFEAFGMINLQYKVRICHKLHNKDTMRLNDKTSYYLFRRYVVTFVALVSNLWNLQFWAIARIGKKGLPAKLYTPSTLNIALIQCLTWQWHTQLIMCAENVKSWFKSWGFPFTFQAYFLPHTLNCMCVSLFKFHIWILEQF